MPHLRAGRVFTHVEVVVVVAFMTRVEMKDGGAQAQRRQQPRLEVVELSPSGGGTGDVEPHGRATYSSTARTIPFGSVLVRATRSNVSCFGGWMMVSLSARNDPLTSEPDFPPHKGGIEHRQRGQHAHVEQPDL